jgi:hypothetical protein
MSPVDRIHVIEKSLRVFVCGVLGIIPLLGLVPAGYAIIAAIQVYKRVGSGWNPAASYLCWGLVVALAAWILTFLAAGALWIQMTW